MQIWKKHTWNFGAKRAVLALFLCCFLPATIYGQIGIKPVITAQPKDTIVTNGVTATFTVEAYSLLGVTYTWFHNGVKLSNTGRISGTDSTTCTIQNVGAADAGSYYAEVRNLIGPENSIPATLSIIYPPVRIDSARSVTNGIRLQMSGPIASNYVISASANLIDWLPISTNAALSGSVTFTDTTATSRPMRFYRAVAR